MKYVQNDNKISLARKEKRALCSINIQSEKNSSISTKETFSPDKEPSFGKKFTIRCKYK